MIAFLLFVFISEIRGEILFASIRVYSRINLYTLILYVR